jgi:hypothetical protein
MIADSLLGRFVAFLHHGALLVEDPASAATHAQWDPERRAYDVDDGSILVLVQTAVDGPVEVEVHDVEGAQDDLTSGLVSLVVASIATPDDTLRIHDPEDRVALVVQPEREHTSTPLPVRVLVDDVEHAARVVVLLG